MRLKLILYALVSVACMSHGLSIASDLKEDIKATYQGETYKYDPASGHVLDDQGKQVQAHIVEKFRGQTLITHKEEFIKISPSNNDEVVHLNIDRLGFVSVLYSSQKWSAVQYKLP
jgi:hypothetical protein